MEPENFTFSGFVVLIAGFILVGFGALFLGQVYFCVIGASTCSSEATTRIGYAIPMLVFGSLLIITGTILTAAGHISEHLRPIEISEEKPGDESSKLTKSA